MSQRPIELRELSKKGVGVGMLASRVHLDPVQNRRSHMAMSILYPPLELGVHSVDFLDFLENLISRKRFFFPCGSFFRDRIRNRNGLRSIFQF